MPHFYFYNPATNHKLQDFLFRVNPFSSVLRNWNN